MIIAKEVGVRMIKDYFEIEASKATQQYGFQKGSNLFGDEGYQAAKDELEKNLFGRGCIDILSTYNVPWNFIKQTLGYLMFLKKKQ